MAVIGTAFIVPNTIATVFGTPVGEHVEWHTQLLIMVFSTLVSVAVVYMFVRKRSILPPKEG